MTNIERILSTIATYPVGMKEAALMAVVHRLVFAPVETIAREFNYSIRGTQALIYKLHEKGVLIKHPQKGLKRLKTQGPKEVWQWRLDWKIHILFDEMEQRAPLKGVQKKLKPIKQPKRCKSPRSKSPTGLASTASAPTTSTTTSNSSSTTPPSSGASWSDWS